MVQGARTHWGFKGAVWMGILSSLLLFLGFNLNAWRVVDPCLFEQRSQVDSPVVGRIAESRRQGIFSSGGLLEWRSPGTYRPYRSQVGGQGILFSCLDRVMPFSPQATLRFFRALTAFLSSLVLTFIILWFFRMFGSWVALVTLSSLVLSPCLVLFGDSLYWCLWAFYLPMLVVMYDLQSDRTPTRRRAWVFASLVFLTILVKCLINGYEYVTTALLMMMVPAVFYAVLGRWRASAVLQYGFLAVIASGLAILLTLGVLCVQIAAVDGTFLAGVGHILSCLGRRAYGDPSRYPSIAASLSASPLQVMAMYLKGTFLESPFVRYDHLIAVFGAASVYLCWATRRDPVEDRRRSIRALIFTTWFSILAPLSWFVVFKAHAFLHPFFDFIVWQMPFTLYGFALCGIASQYAWRGIR